MDQSRNLTNNPLYTWDKSVSVSYLELPKKTIIQVSDFESLDVLKDIPPGTVEVTVTPGKLWNHAKKSLYEKDMIPKQTEYYVVEYKNPLSQRINHIMKCKTGEC